MPLDKELKWSYLWSLWTQRHKKERVPRDGPYYFLRDFKIDTLADFIKESILLTSSIYCNITVTAFSNYDEMNPSERKFMKWHIQNIMQRIEMDMQHSIDNLCVLFVDPVNPDKDKLLRNSYHDIFVDGDFIEEYRHIKDSLNMEFSHDSVGIQLADFIAGAFNGFLRGYDTSTDIVKCSIYPKLRKKPENSEVIGFGVIDVPSNTKFREFLQSKICKLAEP